MLTLRCVHRLFVLMLFSKPSVNVVAIAKYLAILIAFQANCKGPEYVITSMPAAGHIACVRNRRSRRTAGVSTCAAKELAEASMSRSFSVG